MHDHHELVLVSSSADCQIVNNGNAVQLSTPCIFLNRAGSFHEVVEVSRGDYESSVVFFHPQVLSRIPKDMWFEKQLFNADMMAISLTEAQLQSLVPLFSMLHTGPYIQQLPLLLTVFATIVQILHSGAEPIRTEATGNYIFAVVRHLQAGQEKWNISQLAQQFYVCPTKLKADFKRITGMPVMTYKNHICLEKARLLLETTNMAQAQIAYTCGFFDESYFIRAFRKRYEITPAAYRKQCESRKFALEH